MHTYLSKYQGDVSQHILLILSSCLLNQYSPFPRARSSIAGKNATHSVSKDLCRLRKTAVCVLRRLIYSINLLNQYSPVPRARSSIVGKDATRPVGARVARAQIYAGLGKYKSSIFKHCCSILPDTLSWYLKINGYIIHCFKNESWYTEHILLSNNQIRTKHRDEYYARQNTANNITSCSAKHRRTCQGVTQHFV